MTLWNRLHTLSKFTFKAQSFKEGWVRQGHGSVCLSKKASSHLLLKHEGWWQEDSSSVSFTNQMHWVLASGMLTLELLRYQSSLRLPLKEISPALFASVTPHVCADDVYSCQITILPSCLNLKWVIRGPKKNEEIDYFYDGIKRRTETSC